jgi:hypothetical protein
MIWDTWHERKKESGMKSWTIVICRLHMVMAVLLGALFFPGCSREPAPAECDPVAEANALGPDEVGEVCGYAYSDLVASEWATSEDGAVSVRLLSPRAASALDEPFVLLVELRNNTDEMMTFYAPLNSPSIQITRPNGSRIDWCEWPVDTQPILRFPPFFVIASGITLPGRYEFGYDWLNQPGIYTIEFTYASGGQQQIDYYLAHPEEYSVSEPGDVEMPPRGYASLGMLFPSTDPTKTVPTLWVGELHVGPLTVARR